jgi:threonine aldolase
MRVSDFRSDTVTKPTGSMLRAMASAELGDDVFEDDPTVSRLEELAAGKFGKEGALFVPSGVMGNLVALLVHTRPGDEVLLEENSHTFHFETGGAAAVAGVQTRTIPSERGIPSMAALEDGIRPDNIHFPVTSAIIYENTNNISGGVIVPLEVMGEVYALASSRGVAVHLDGARIWNAHVASGVPLPEYAARTDSIMCCLSKGLSAPVGSMLIGSKVFIREARRARKRLGGGMRQVGVLAAAGIVALEEMIDRLAEDHRRARRLADGLANTRGLIVHPEHLHTNIVIFRLAGPVPPYDALETYLAEKGVRVTNLWGRGIRLVTHRGVDDADVERALDAVGSARREGIFGSD